MLDQQIVNSRQGVPAQQTALSKGSNKGIKSNFNLSFNNSFNTSFATNNNNNNTSGAEKQARMRTSPDIEPAIPSMTLSAQAVAEGKSLISHGPLTIDLSALEQQLVAKMGGATAVPPQQPTPSKKSFQEVIDQDGGKLASLLTKITGAYEEYVRSMLSEKTEGAAEEFKICDDSNNETVQEQSKEESTIKTPQISVPVSERDTAVPNEQVQKLKTELEEALAKNQELREKEDDKN